MRKLGYLLGFLLAIFLWVNCFAVMKSNSNSKLNSASNSTNSTPDTTANSKSDSADSTTSNSTADSTPDSTSNSTSNSTSDLASNSTSNFLKNFYVGAEGGYSFGNYINLKPTSTAACTSTMQCWTNPTQSFNSDLGESFVYGAKIGYQVNPLVAIDLGYDARNKFGWSKHFPPGGFPNSRNRSISTLRNQTLLANVYLTPNLRWSTLDPYVNGGIGWAWNKTGTLTDVNLNTGQVSRISGDNTSSFAWDIGFGANIILNKNVFFDAGYRYIDLGIIQTGKRVISPPPVLPIPRLRTKTAYTNELYIGVNFLV